MTPPRRSTARGADIERALGRTLALGLPWLAKVQPLPDCGMPWARFLLEHDDAANDAGAGLTP